MRFVKHSLHHSAQRGAAGLVARWLAILVSLVWLVQPQESQAGGGPENVLLVVNARSWASKTIANHYVKLRGIPARNVIYLDWSDRLFDAITVDVFREKILGPIIQAIEGQGIGNQIDYVIYSADFPTTISFQSDAGKTKLPPQLSPFASLNAMTYYYQFVALKNPLYLHIGPDPYSNLYYRRPAGAPKDAATRAFRNWYGWNGDGEPVEAGGQRYLLSTLLAVTGGKGNSVSEVIAYLKASQAADGTRPKGTIYYMDNPDPRSAVRLAAADVPTQPNFADAVAALKKLGVAAEVAKGVYPQNKPDVQGLMMGSEKFDWAASRSKIRPGAICEHLTSFGGMFDDAIKQTPLTEFLRYGAAGASGTIIEPYLILQKFPSPFVQVHYARGASLAEAFYQATAGPFQLLIVGDALCQPWANIPQVNVSGVTAKSEVKGVIKLKPSARLPGGGSVQRFMLFVDGLAVAGCVPGETITFDTRRLVDGYHELSLVAIEHSAVESQGRWMAPITVNNEGASCQLQAAAASKTVTAGAPLNVTVDSPGAARIVVTVHTRQVGVVEGASGTIEVDTKDLGFGPVRLKAVAFDATPRERAVSAPLEFELFPPPSLSPSAPEGRTKTGILLTRADGSTQSIGDTTKHDWLETSGVKPQSDYTVSGYVQVPYDDVYQFHLAHFGGATLRVGNTVVYQGNDLTSWPMHYIPVSLKPGKHRVEIKGKATQIPRLELRFGGPGALRAGATNFEHE